MEAAGANGDFGGGDGGGCGGATAAPSTHFFAW